ncbi:MAG: hypothetical protein IJU84_03545 [Clostridia bacterium]|nr:hypothetical protein [Clostridia bacterium]
MSNLFIDVGSTNIKYSEDDGNINIIDFPHPTNRTEHIFEVPIDRITDSITAVINGSAAKRVYFSVQMHGYVLSDEKHLPLTEYISWRDARYRLLGRGEYPFFLPAESGTAIKDNLPALSIYAGQSLYPEVYSKAVYVDTLGSYLTYYLTGNAVVHVTDACPTGFYISATGELNHDVTGLPYFKGLKFPAATTRIEQAGSYLGKAIFSPVGDQQASVYSAGVTAEDYLLNTGTTSQICCLSDIFETGDFESRPYFNGKTLCTVSGLIGGGAPCEVKGKEDILIENYGNAIKRLPKRSGLIFVGTFVERYREQFERIGGALSGNYRYANGASAIEGLKKLAEDHDANEI